MSHPDPTPDEILKAGREQPLPDEEMRRILHKILQAMKQSAERRGDQETLQALNAQDEDAIVERMIASRKTERDAHGNNPPGH